MKLDKEAVEHLAQLAKIALSEEEKVSIQKDLASILEFFEQLNAVKTDDVPETSQVTGLEDVVRSDKPSYTFDRDAMLATMPNVDAEGFLRVHEVFTGDSPSH